MSRFPLAGWKVRDSRAGSYHEPPGVVSATLNTLEGARLLLLTSGVDTSTGGGVSTPSPAPCALAHGDFNAVESSAAMATLWGTGFVDAFRTVHSTAITCDRASQSDANRDAAD